MKQRRLGKTEMMVSEISLGTWQVGGVWGQAFDPKNAERLLRTAIDHGVNFIDTADVYSDGLSEKVVGKVVKSSNAQIFVATKCGRRLNPHHDQAYTNEALRQFVEDSLSNMGLECIDLIQLHCMPTDTYYRPEIFGLFERLKEEGKIHHLGVSVEKVEQALKAIEYANVTTVQIIFNMFRHRPSGLFFEQARKRDIGIIARVPLASGLLSGKYSRETKFEPGDHRRDNVHGALFDRGETFSGVDYEKGLAAVEKLSEYFGERPLSQVALRWILAFEEVSTVIPGASKIDHLLSNLEADKLDPLTAQDMNFVRSVYEQHVMQDVHHLW